MLQSFNMRRPWLVALGCLAGCSGNEPHALDWQLGFQVDALRERANRGGIGVTRRGESTQEASNGMTDMLPGRDVSEPSSGSAPRNHGSGKGVGCRLTLVASVASVL